MRVYLSTELENLVRCEGGVVGSGVRKCAWTRARRIPFEGNSLFERDSNKGTRWVTPLSPVFRTCEITARVMLQVRTLQYGLFAWNRSI